MVIAIPILEEVKQAGAYWTPFMVTCIFIPYRAYLLFIRYSHYDGSAHGDGNKKPPEGGWLMTIYFGALEECRRLYFQTLEPFLA